MIKYLEIHAGLYTDHWYKTRWPKGYHTSEQILYNFAYNSFLIDTLLKVLLVLEAKTLLEII